MECDTWLNHVVYNWISFLQFFFPGVRNCLLFPMYLSLKSFPISWLMCKSSSNSFQFHLLCGISLQPLSSGCPSGPVVTLHHKADVLGSLAPFSWGFLSLLSWVQFLISWLLRLLSRQVPHSAGAHPAVASWERRHTGAKFLWTCLTENILFYSHTGTVIIRWK